MTTFKEGDEVLIRATVKNVYANGYIDLRFATDSVEQTVECNEDLVSALMQSATNRAIIEHPDLIPASALDVNKELLEALTNIAGQKLYSEIEDKSSASFEDGYDMCVMIAREAIAAAEKGA